MRNIINKYVPHDEILQTAREIYRRNWRTVKLYFMIGHPMEELEDVQAIIDLAKALKTDEFFEQIEQVTDISSLDYVAASWSVQEGSQEAGGLDAVFLLKTAIPVMAVLLMLQGCAIILNNILVITGNKQPDKA